MMNNSGIKGNTTTGAPVQLTAGVALWQGYMIFLGMAFFAFIVAKGSMAVRKRVFQDQDNIDMEFDAGGKASVGIVATTIVSYWTWAATLLQSTSVASKYGISGAFWYASGATIQLFLFAMLTVQLKIRAPGAKTFLQVIKARFGKTAHVTYCVFALMTNVIVTAMLMLGGAAVLTNLVQGLCVELATVLVAATISTYTFMGGLGSAFYVSYFNTAIMMIIMMIFVVKVYFCPTLDSPLGSIEKVFLSVNGSIGPVRNLDSSYLTMSSFDAFMFGIINIVGNFGTVFVDQSFWQCGLAARPRNGVWGFIFGGLTWFGVPFTFATTMGLAYLSLSAEFGQPLLSSNAVDQGMVAPIVAERMLGWQGQLMVVLMIVMTITSTGSAEVIAVTSILVYDIYQIYLKPFRMVFDASTCILCGRERGHMANVRDQCRCISMTYCKTCFSDNETRAHLNWKRAVKPSYTCLIHGTYRTYNEFLHRLKNWGQICATIAIIPLTIILNALAISLNWVYLFMGVLVGSAVIPIVLTLFWSRLSGAGMVAGAIGGALLGIIVWLIVASQEPMGLRNFVQSTGTQRSMLAGNLVSLLSGGLITVVVSIHTNRHADRSQLLRTWERTRDIDNPLRPWTEVYAKEMGLKRFNVLNNRPSLEDTEKRYRLDKILAIVFGSALTFAFLIVWPLATISAGVMDFTAFTHWIRFMTAYGFLATILIIIVPVVTEIYEMRKYLHERNSVRDEDVAVVDHQQLQAAPGEGALPPTSGIFNGVVDDGRKCSGERRLRNTRKLFTLENIAEKTT